MSLQSINKTPIFFFSSFSFIKFLNIKRVFFFFFFHHFNRGIDFFKYTSICSDDLKAIREERLRNFVPVVCRIGAAVAVSGTRVGTDGN